MASAGEQRGAIRRRRGRAAAAALLCLALWVAAAAASCFAALVQPKRPASSYMLWLSEARPAIAKKLKTTDVTLIAKEAGAQWKTVAAAKKKPFEAQAAKLKKAYEADKKKFLAAGGVIEIKKKGEKAAKPKKDPNAPKRPSSSYMLWLNANRKGIVAKLPAKDKKNVAAVAAAAGKAWKTVTKTEKAKYEKQFKADKAKYEKAKAKYEAGKA